MKHTHSASLFRASYRCCGRGGQQVFFFFSFLFFSAAAAFLKLACRCSPPSPVSYDKYLKSCPPRHLRMSREHRRCRKNEKKEKAAKPCSDLRFSRSPPLRHPNLAPLQTPRLPRTPPLLVSRLETHYARGCARAERRKKPSTARRLRYATYSTVSCLCSHAQGSIGRVLV